MKNTNKKILSLIMALVIVFSTGYSAFAAIAQAENNKMFSVDRDNVLVGEEVSFITDIELPDDALCIKVSYTVPKFNNWYGTEVVKDYSQDSEDLPYTDFGFVSASSDDVKIDFKKQRYYNHYFFDVSYSGAGNKCSFITTFTVNATGMFEIKPDISYRNAVGNWVNVDCDSVYVNVYNSVDNIVGRDDYKINSRYVTHTNYVTRSNYVTQSDYYRTNYNDDYRCGVSGNIKWNLNILSGLLRITGKGDMYDYDYPRWRYGRYASEKKTAPWLMYSDFIKTIIIDERITYIGSYAFYGLSITDIKIPDKVKKIGYYAFANCYNLNLVEFGSGRKYIGGHAFENCYNIRKLVYTDKKPLYIVYGYGSGVSWYLPNNYYYTYYGPNYNNESFHRSYNIGNYSLDQVKWIQKCVNHSYVKIDNDIDITGYESKHNYDNNTDQQWTIPSRPGAKSVSITFSNNTRFYDGSDYLYIIDGYGIYHYYYNNYSYYRDTDGYYHETYYSSLSGRTVTVPGNSAELYFHSNSSGTAYGFKVTNITYNYDESVIPGVTEYVCEKCGKAFDGNDIPLSENEGYCGENAKYVLSDDGTLSIYGEGAVYNTAYWYNHREDIKKIIVEDGITVINTNAFNGLDEVESVTLPDTLKNIKYAAFYGCSKLKEITIPENASLGGYAFRNCTSLEKLTYSNNWRGISDILKCCCQNCVSLSTVEIADTVDTIPHNFFNNCYGLETIILPDTIKEIGSEAFYNCRDLKNIVIPDSVEDIGYSAFAGCESLEHIKLPDKLVIISNNLFANCKSLVSVEIPDSIITIADGVFYGCTSLEEFTIPKNIKYLGSHIFDGCESLNTIYYNATQCKEVNYNGIYAYPQSVFGDVKNFVIGKNVVSLPEYLLCDCDYLKSVVIPENVEYIPNYTFYKCDRLESVIFESEEYVDISVGSFAESYNVAIVCKENSYLHYFAEVNNLKYYILDNENDPAYIVKNDILTSYTGSSDTVFVGCASKIGYGAFSGNYRLNSVELAGNVTRIYNQAFKNCTNLEKIIIPDSVVSIGDNAFAGCEDLTIYGYADSYAEAFADSHNIPFVAIELKIANTLVEMGTAEKIQLETTTNANSVEKPILKWSSSNPVIAEVSPNGTVTGCDYGETKITATDKHGLTSSCVVRVDVKIKDNINAEFEDNYICGEALIDNNIDEFKNLFNNDNIEIQSTGNVGTGDKIIFRKNNGDIYKTYEVMIFGDIDGNGVYDGNDAVIAGFIANGMLTKEQVGETAYLAADCNHDGTVNEKDVEILNQAGLLLEKVGQSNRELLLAPEYTELIVQSFETPEIPIEEEKPEQKQEKQKSVFRIILDFILNLIKTIKSFFKTVER